MIYPPKTYRVEKEIKMDLLFDYWQYRRIENFRITSYLKGGKTYFKIDFYTEHHSILRFLYPHATTLWHKYPNKGVLSLQENHIIIRGYKNLGKTPLEIFKTFIRNRNEIYYRWKHHIPVMNYYYLLDDKLTFKMEQILDEEFYSVMYHYMKGEPYTHVESEFKKSYSIACRQKNISRSLFK